MILLESLALVTVGIVLGGLAAVLLARFIESMLFGLQSIDPPTLIASIMVMMFAAFLATWWPARHAARIDPMTALRQD